MSVLAVQQTGTRWSAQRSGDVAVIETEPGGSQLVNVGEELLQHRFSQQLALRIVEIDQDNVCLLYTSPSPRDKRQSRMPSSA